jgi:hypothetical protein
MSDPTSERDPREDNPATGSTPQPQADYGGSHPRMLDYEQAEPVEGTYGGNFAWGIGIQLGLAIACAIPFAILILWVPALVFTIHAAGKRRRRPGLFQGALCGLLLAPLVTLGLCSVVYRGL